MSKAVFSMFGRNSCGFGEECIISELSKTFYYN